MSGVSALARASYARFEAYEPGRVPVRLDLSDNTNQSGVPPHARAALLDAAAGAGPGALTRYPSVYGSELKRALAKLAGVEPMHVVTGCGSDDVLDSAVRAFSRPGDRLVFPAPTFSMLPHLAWMNDLEPVAVPLRADFSLDVDAMLAAGAGSPRTVTYLCTPNNPTGTVVPPEVSLEVLSRTQGLVIVDEAYVEYGGVSLAAEAPHRERLLVTRTLSKAFGLAGMRVGYGVGSPELVSIVEKSRGPYKVGGVAERMAVEAVTRDLPWVRAEAARVVEARARFVSELDAMGLRSVPSEANFVLVPVPSAQAATLALRERGIGVRPFAACPYVGDAIRVSLAPWPVLEEVVSALREVLA